MASNHGHHMPARRLKAKKGRPRTPYTKASPVVVRDLATGEVLGEHRAYTPPEMSAVVKGRRNITG